jgi:hypothetical protein
MSAAAFAREDAHNAATPEKRSEHLEKANAYEVSAGWIQRAIEVAQCAKRGKE